MRWLGLVGGLIDTGNGYLRIAANSSASLAEKSALIQDAENIGNRAYELLVHMQGASADHIPHQIVAPFQRWVTRLGIADTIFFRAEHAPNYELSTIELRPFISRLNNPSSSLIEAAADINWPVRRVTVPSQAMGMLPHFAVVGHELGHAIQDLIRPDFSKFSAEEAACLGRIQTRLTAAGITWGHDESVLTTEILSSWIAELKSDAVGHFLAGPAFYFALFGFLELASQGYGIGSSHPPSELRRALLLQHLALGTPSFLDVFAAETASSITGDLNSPHLAPLPAPDTLYAELEPLAGARFAAIVVELVPLAETLAPEIYASAEAHLASTAPDLVYTPKQLEFDLRTHLSPLCTLIPPIEFREGRDTLPTELATVLNVGWAALLARLDSIPPALGGSDVEQVRMERLHELLLKAVELAEAKRVWEEHQ